MTTILLKICSCMQRINALMEVTACPPDVDLYTLIEQSNVKGALKFDRSIRVCRSLAYI